MKSFNFRLSKKIVIPVIAVVVLVAGFFVVKSVRFNNEKAQYAALAQKSYDIRNGKDSDRVILKIDGEDITYGELMCQAELCKNSITETDSKKNIENAFVPYLFDISSYEEVLKRTKDDKNFVPTSDEELKSRMKMGLEVDLKCNNARVAGFAQIKLKHMDEDFVMFKKHAIMQDYTDNVTNTKEMSTSSISNDDYNKLSKEKTNIMNELITTAKKNATIEYVDKSYSYLTKDLLPDP